MKTSPWFSTEEAEQDKEAVPVYHDNTSCMEGDSIEKNHHRYGTDNRPLCTQCSRLDEAGR
jgi:hypothetical protein